MIKEFVKWRGYEIEKFIRDHLAPKCISDIVSRPKGIFKKINFEKYQQQVPANLRNHALKKLIFFHKIMLHILKNKFASTQNSWSSSS